MPAPVAAVVEVPVEPPTSVATVSVPGAPAAPAIVFGEEGDFWHSTVQQMVATDTVTGLARELALQSQLVSHADSRWVIRIERESLNQPMSRERLRVALDAISPGASLDVEVGQVVDSPGKRNAAATAEKQRIAEEIILGDPLVQSLMRDYGAKIVPGTLKPL
jgi:DNA polymerase-3 subunit gamma/tau